MKVLIAPDSFGGTLTAPQAANAVARGWARARPDDELVVRPMSDGGEGLLDTVRGDGDRTETVEVADPLGKPRQARWLRRADGSAVIESAEACGLRHLGTSQRDPLRTTTYGVGQLLEAARRAGVRRIAVGLGGSATVDGGAGAVAALGARVQRVDGSGLKIGGGELDAVSGLSLDWVDPGWDEVEVELWSDVTTVLTDAARVFGPQKGATPDKVEILARGLATWADVVERDLDGRWRDEPGTGAAGGLGFGLLAVLGARIVPGAAAVGAAIGLPGELDGADLVVTGEGALDATSGEGKVVGYLAGEAARRGIDVAAVVGRERGRPDGLAAVVESSPRGPGEDPAGDLANAAERLARAW